MKILAGLRLTTGIAFGVLGAAAPALAGMDVQVDYGQRAVDFHRFTDAAGAKTGWGTDVGTTWRYRKDKAPWAIGAFYHQQSFDLNPNVTYFETVRTTELGVDAVFQLDDKGLVPQLDLAYTALGSITAQTVDPAILHASQGGGLATSGEAVWAYEMHGVHVTPGVQWNLTKGASIVLGADFSMQSANLQSVKVRTLDASDTYKSYAKTRSEFDSYAVMIGARAEL
jgi:hypothetical protein